MRLPHRPHRLVRRTLVRALLHLTREPQRTAIRVEFPLGGNRKRSPRACAHPARSPKKTVTIAVKAVVKIARTPSEKIAVLCVPIASDDSAISTSPAAVDGWPPKLLQMT